MEAIQIKLDSSVNHTEYSRIPHVIYLNDFNTNHPNPNRIERISREIDEYMEIKKKYTEVKI